MGISHLESVVEDTKCCTVVDIKKLADLYTARTGKKPVAVIDGTNLVKHFYLAKNRNFDSVCGGQLRSFTCLLKDFVNRLKELEIEPIFYFDGPTAKTKMDMRKTRNVVKANKSAKVFAHVSNEKKTDLRELGIFPLLLSVTSRFIVKFECKCEVRVSTAECDEQLADYAYRESCFAVFSQDTDFLCMKNATYYLSIKHLNMHNMTTKLYDRCGVLSYYSLTEKQMWLFATLSGNGIISVSKLRKFHQAITYENGNVQNAENNYNKFVYHDFKFKKVAEFVQKVTEKCSNEIEQAIPVVMTFLEKAAVDVTEEDLRGSLRSYQPSEMERWIADDTIQGSWCEILELAYKRHVECDAIPDVYGTLVGIPYEIGQFLEKAESPQQESSRIFLPLRQRIYSLLLHEKPFIDNAPCNVVEFGMWDGRWHGLEDMMKIYVPKLTEDLFHPGLIDLWTKNSQKINLQRWTLFAKIICPDLDPAVFYRLKFHHVVPLAVLLYLNNPQAQKMQMQDQQLVLQESGYLLTNRFLNLAWWRSLFFNKKPDSIQISNEENSQLQEVQVRKVPMKQEHTQSQNEKQTRQKQQKGDFQHQPTANFPNPPRSQDDHQQDIYTSRQENQAFRLRECDVDSFIKQAVTISSLELKDLEQNKLLRNGTITRRTINLSMLFGYGISMVLFLMSALGFHLEKAMPWYYFDGPLFHYFLKERKRGHDALSDLSDQLSASDLLRIREDFRVLKESVTRNKFHEATPY